VQLCSCVTCWRVSRCGAGSGRVCLSRPALKLHDFLNCELDRDIGGEHQGTENQEHRRANGPPQPAPLNTLRVAAWELLKDHLPARDQFFELILCSIDLLLKYGGPFLQVSSDVTHRFNPARLVPPARNVSCPKQPKPLSSPQPFGSDCASIRRSWETTVSRQLSQPRLSRPQKQRRNPSQICLVG